MSKSEQVVPGSRYNAGFLSVFMFKTGTNRRFVPPLARYIRGLAWVPWGELCPGRAPVLYGMAGFPYIIYVRAYISIYRGCGNRAKPGIGMRNRDCSRTACVLFFRSGLYKPRDFRYQEAGLCPIF